MGSAEQEVADGWAEGAVWPLPVCDVVAGAVVASTPSGSRPRDPGSKASDTVTVGSQSFALSRKLESLIALLRQSSVDRIFFFAASGASQFSAFQVWSHSRNAQKHPSVPSRVSTAPCLWWIRLWGSFFFYRGSFFFTQKTMLRRNPTDVPTWGVPRQ